MTDKPELPAPTAGPSPRNKATLCRILQRRHQRRARKSRRRRWLLNAAPAPRQRRAKRPEPITISLN